MNQRLKRLPVVKRCKNCAVTFGTSADCKTCTRNKEHVDNWRPELDLCKKLVLWYAKQKAPISAPEIAKYIGGNLKPVVVEGAIAELIAEGKLKVETSVVIME